MMTNLYNFYNNQLDFIEGANKNFSDYLKICV